MTITIEVTTVGLIACSAIWGFTAVMVAEVYAGYMSGYRRQEIQYIRNVMDDWKRVLGERLNSPATRQLSKDLLQGFTRAVAGELRNRCSVRPPDEAVPQPPADKQGSVPRPAPETKAEVAKETKKTTTETKEEKLTFPHNLARAFQLDI